MSVLERPGSHEYGTYYANYIGQVPDGDIFALLEQQIDTLKQLIGSLSDAQSAYKFAPKEWTIKEVIGHINDTERVFSYRALRFARADETPLAGFDQDQYVQHADFAVRPFSTFIQEFELLRRANLLCLGNLTPDAYLRRGTASGNPFTVRALIYAMYGHVNHHLGSLRTDYGVNGEPGN